MNSAHNAAQNLPPDIAWPYWINHYIGFPFKSDLKSTIFAKNRSSKGECQSVIDYMIRWWPTAPQIKVLGSIRSFLSFMMILTISVGFSHPSQQRKISDFYQILICIGPSTDSLKHSGSVITKSRKNVQFFPNTQIHAKSFFDEIFFT